MGSVSYVGRNESSNLGSQPWRAKPATADLCRGKILIPQSHDHSALNIIRNGTIILRLPAMVAARNIIALTALRKVPQSAKQTARQGKRRFNLSSTFFSNFTSKILVHQAIGVYC